MKRRWKEEKGDRKETERVDSNELISLGQTFEVGLMRMRLVFVLLTHDQPSKQTHTANTPSQANRAVANVLNNLSEQSETCLLVLDTHTVRGDAKLPARTTKMGTDGGRHKATPHVRCTSDVWELQCRRSAAHGPHDVSRNLLLLGMRLRLSPAYPRCSSLNLLMYCNTDQHPPSAVPSLRTCVSMLITVSWV